MTNSDLVALLEIFQDSLESRVTTERELTRQRPYSQDVLDNLNAALSALKSGAVVLRAHRANGGDDERR